MSPYIADLIFTILAFTVPIILIAFFKWRGVVCGAIWHWIILICAGEYLKTVDPEYYNEIGSDIWILLGWIGSLIYCVAIKLTIGLIRNEKRSVGKCSETSGVYSVGAGHPSKGGFINGGKLTMSKIGFYVKWNSLYRLYFRLREPDSAMSNLFIKYDDIKEIFVWISNIRKDEQLKHLIIRGNFPLEVLSINILNDSTDSEKFSGFLEQLKQHCPNAKKLAPIMAENISEVALYKE